MQFTACDFHVDFFMMNNFGLIPSFNFSKNDLSLQDFVRLFLVDFRFKMSKPESTVNWLGAVHNLQSLR